MRWVFHSPWKNCPFHFHFPSVYPLSVSSTSYSPQRYFPHRSLPCLPSGVEYTQLSRLSGLPTVEMGPILQQMKLRLEAWVLAQAQDLHRLLRVIWDERE